MSKVKEITKKVIDKVKTDKKTQIILGVILLFLVGTIMIINLRPTSANEETGTVIENQIVDGLSFENAQVVIENGISKYTAEIYNDLESAYSLKYIEVIFKDSSSNKITTIYGYVGETIESNQVKYLDISTDQEITNISTVEYIIHK